VSLKTAVRTMHMTIEKWGVKRMENKTVMHCRVC